MPPTATAQTSHCRCGIGASWNGRVASNRASRSGQYGRLRQRRSRAFERLEEIGPCRPSSEELIGNSLPSTPASGSGPQVRHFTVPVGRRVRWHLAITRPCKYVQSRAAYGPDSAEPMQGPAQELGLRRRPITVSMDRRPDLVLGRRSRAPRAPAPPAARREFRVGDSGAARWPGSLDPRSGIFSQAAVKVSG